MNEPGRNGLQLGHADFIRAAAESVSSAAQSALAASWRRSLLYHRLDPETRSPTRQGGGARRCARRASASAHWRRSPVPIIDRVLNAVGRAGCCVLLTDSNGLIVERRGMAADDEIFSEWGLWTGAIWSEAKEGTNGIGTCLAEQRPVAILRDQHFRTRNTAMSCLGAPIFDDQARLAGVLDVSSCRGDLMGDLAPLIATVIADAARRIESEAFRAAFPDCRIVMTPAHGHRGCCAARRRQLRPRCRRNAHGAPDVGPDGELPCSARRRRPRQRTAGFGLASGRAGRAAARSRPNRWQRIRRRPRARHRPGDPLSADEAAWGCPTARNWLAHPVARAADGQEGLLLSHN